MTKGDLAKQRRREGIRQAFAAEAEVRRGRKVLDVAAESTGWELKEEKHLALRTTGSKE
jgi:hypothetical protein